MQQELPSRPSSMIVRSVVLQGRWISLQPMLHEHVDALCVHGLDPELWRWVPSAMKGREDMLRYVESALVDQARGLALPFVIVDQASGQVIGSTRFANISVEDRRLEIGWTWLARSHQRSSANTEAKTLLLTHAFETLGAMRVELKTDALNETSRRAIARIGAVQEGIFRRHMLTHNGRVRDTVYFSIVDEEWPAVKLRLQSLAQR